MTRQEAIEILVGVIKTQKAIDMAIKALEQETVSREAYDHEFNLRKEFEMKVFELENKMAEQDKIIHCKECKHWHEWENGTGACHRSNSLWIGSDYDDYCSYAEKKGSDTE